MSSITIIVLYEGFPPGFIKECCVLSFDNMQNKAIYLPSKGHFCFIVFSHDPSAELPSVISTSLCGADVTLRLGTLGYSS